MLAAFQQRVRSEIGVTVSVGLAQNKSMAKIASDQDKPDGYYVIGEVQAQSWLHDKPVQILFGLGKVSTKKLNAAGLHKCGDIAACPAPRLRTLLGRDAERVKQLACGIDPRVVETSRAAKSVSSETTFALNISALPDLLSIAETLAQSVSQRLKDQQMDAVNVTVKLKRPNHQLLTRTRRLDRPTQMAHRLFEVAAELIEKEASPDKSWRLLRLAFLLLTRQQAGQKRLNRGRTCLPPLIRMTGTDRTGWKKRWTACAPSWAQNWSRLAAGSPLKPANKKTPTKHKADELLRIRMTA